MAIKRVWKYKPPGDYEQVQKLMNEINVSRPIANLLVQRGITNYEDAKNFFRPNLKMLHDPFEMKDMDVAVERILKAINNSEKILVYGDYDVDGTSAVTLIYSFLSRLTKHIDFYIPDRYNEGYGISYQGIDYAHQNDFKLVITLDCGIKAVDKITYGKEKGIDFIICDHHKEGDVLPPAVAILNPKRKDCNYPYKELSGCGVGFKLVQALAKVLNIPFDDIKHYLDLVVLSIAADIVPITGENRILAYHGLQRINTNPCPGIESCLRTVGIKRRPESLEKVKYNFTKYITISDLVFSVSPRVNAAGRIDNAKNSVQLLLSSTLNVAEALAEKINSFNTERKNLDKQAFEEAMQMIKENPELQNRKSTVLYNPSWHKGVIGIVASRLIDHYYRPTIIFTQSNGLLTGSARSIKDFDLYQAIEECSDLLEHFGGHKFAAGLSIKPENYNAFCNRFEEVTRSLLTDDMLIPEIEIDDIIDFHQITPRFNNILQQFAPFGPGNMSPIFLTRNVYDTGLSKMVGDNHLKLNITQPDYKGPGFDAIAFQFGHLYDYIKSAEKPIKICYHIEENEWNGKTTIQLNIKDIEIDDVDEDTYY